MFNNKILTSTIILTLLTLTITVNIQQTISCSCALPESAITALNKSTVVFSGKAIKVKYIDPQTQDSPEPRIIVTFKVDQVWKGKVGKTFEIQTVFNKWTCRGFFFAEGNEYLVFSYLRKNDPSEYPNFDKKYSNIYDVSLCSGTNLLSQSKSFLEELGKGKSP
ncbi:MAG: hypothetical protein AB1782_06210 [Cyanobacteriota bacterium]